VEDATSEHDEVSGSAALQRRKDQLLRAQNLLKTLLSQEKIRPQVDRTARAILERVETKLHKKDFNTTWSQSGFLNVQANTEGIKLDTVSKLDKSTALAHLVEAKKTLNQDYANIAQLEKEHVFDKSTAIAQKKEAQDRFDKVKAVFDAISSQSVGVTTAREGGRGGETAGDSSDDDAEMDAALSRLTGEAGTADKKKKRSFFMCMPIPSL